MYTRLVLPALFLAHVLFALPSLAQEDSCQHRTLPLVVVDSGGRSVVGLKLADFEASFRGAAVRINSIAPDNRPRRVVLLLDASGSMHGEAGDREWDVARAIASHIAQSGLPRTSLALVLFSDRVLEVIDFAEDNSGVLSRLMLIAASPAFVTQNVKGKTSLYDSLIFASHMLENHEFSSAIYLISDGGDNASKSKLKDVRKALVSNKVRLYFTQLMPESLRLRSAKSLEESGAVDISDLIADTGGLEFGPVGRVLPTSSAGMVGGVTYDLSTEQRQALSVGLDRLYQGMVGDNLVEIELPRSIDKWSTWTLSLSKEKRKSVKGVSLAYPRQLAPCAAQPH